MTYSIEQNSQFHLARRMAKVVAPQFRVFSTEQLKPGECVLDLKRRTIEIGEGTAENQAIGAVLFQIGHLRLRNDPELQVHAGNFEGFADQDYKKALQLAIQQGKLADEKAAKWAIERMVSNWNVEAPEAHAIVNSYVWSDSEWVNYYGS
jgi:hypothetical protein